MENYQTSQYVLLNFFFCMYCLCVFQYVREILQFTVSLDHPIAKIVLNVRSQGLTAEKWRFFFLQIFSEAEAVPDRLPCKGADVPEIELGVENLKTVVEPCEFLEIN